MKISYDCEELIEELKNDIEEFGDIEMYAFIEKINGRAVLTNYDFIEKEMPLKSEELEDDTVVQIMKASEILKILEEQNRIV